MPCWVSLLDSDVVSRGHNPARIEPYPITLLPPPSPSMPGFAISSKPHHAAALAGSNLQCAGLDSAAARYHHHHQQQQQHQDASARALLRRGRRRRPATKVGAQRDGGYGSGRFSDTEDEPRYRPPPPPPPAGVAAAAGAGRSGRNWQEIGNADVLVPKGVDYPLGLVHFVGGQGVGVFPRNAYGALLEGLVDAGATAVVVAQILASSVTCWPRGRRGGVLVGVTAAELSNLPVVRLCGGVFGVCLFFQRFLCPCPILHVAPPFVGCVFSPVLPPATTVSR